MSASAGIVPPRNTTQAEPNLFSWYYLCFLNGDYDCYNNGQSCHYVHEVNPSLVELPNGGLALMSQQSYPYGSEKDNANSVFRVTQFDAPSGTNGANSTNNIGDALPQLNTNVGFAGASVHETLIPQGQRFSLPVSQVANSTHIHNLYGQNGWIKIATFPIVQTPYYQDSLSTYHTADFNVPGRPLFLSNNGSSVWMNNGITTIDAYHYDGQSQLNLTASFNLLSSAGAGDPVLAAGHNSDWLYVARRLNGNRTLIERFSMADAQPDFGFYVTLNSLGANIDYELTVDKHNNVVLLPRGTVPLQLDNDNTTGSGDGLGSGYVDNEGHTTKALKVELPEVGGCANWKIVEAQSFSAVDPAHVTAVAPESTVISSNLPSSVPVPSSSIPVPSSSPIAYTETSAPPSSAAESMMVTPTQVSSPVPVTTSPEPSSSEVVLTPSVEATMTTMTGEEVSSAAVTSPAVASTAMSSVPVTSSQFSPLVEASTSIDQSSIMASSPVPDTTAMMSSFGPSSSEVVLTPSVEATMTTMTGEEVSSAAVTSPAVASTAMSSVPVTSSQFSPLVEASTSIDQSSIMASSPALMATLTASSESQSNGVASASSATPTITVEGASSPVIESTVMSSSVSASLQPSSPVDTGSTTTPAGQSSMLAPSSADQIAMMTSQTPSSFDMEPTPVTDRLQPSTSMVRGVSSPVVDSSFVVDSTSLNSPLMDSTSVMPSTQDLMSVTSSLTSSMVPSPETTTMAAGSTTQIALPQETSVAPNNISTPTPTKAGDSMLLSSTERMEITSSEQTTSLASSPVVQMTTVAPSPTNQSSESVQVTSSPVVASMSAPSATLPPAPTSMTGQASGMGSGLGDSSGVTPEQTVRMDNSSGSSGSGSGSGQVPGSGDALSSVGTVVSALTSVVPMATQSSVRDETSISSTSTSTAAATPTLSSSSSSSSSSQTIPPMEASSSGTLITTVDQMTTVLSSLSVSSSGRGPSVTSSLVNATIPEQVSTFSATPTTTPVTEEDLQANGNVIKEVILPVSGALGGLLLTTVVVGGSVYCAWKHTNKTKKRRRTDAGVSIENPVFKMKVEDEKVEDEYEITKL